MSIGLAVSGGMLVFGEIRKARAGPVDAIPGQYEGMGLALTLREVFDTTIAHPGRPGAAKPWGLFETARPPNGGNHMTTQGWDASVIDAMKRLRAAGASIQAERSARPEDVHALQTAADEIYAAAERRGTESNPLLDEVRLLAGSLLMAARHGAIASVAVADTIDRLSDLIGD